MARDIDSEWRERARTRPSDRASSECLQVSSSVAFSSYDSGTESFNGAIGTGNYYDFDYDDDYYDYYDFDQYILVGKTLYFTGTWIQCRLRSEICVL